MDDTELRLRIEEASIKLIKLVKTLNLSEADLGDIDMEGFMFTVQDAATDAAASTFKKTIALGELAFLFLAHGGSNYDNPSMELAQVFGPLPIERDRELELLLS